MYTGIYIWNVKDSFPFILQYDKLTWYKKFPLYLDNSWYLNTHSMVLLSKFHPTSYTFPGLIHQHRISSLLEYGHMHITWIRLFVVKRLINICKHLTEEE